MRTISAKCVSTNNCAKCFELMGGSTFAGWIAASAQNQLNPNARG